MAGEYRFNKIMRRQMAGSRSPSMASPISTMSDDGGYQNSPQSQGSLNPLTPVRRTLRVGRARRVSWNEKSMIRHDNAQRVISSPTPPSSILNEVQHPVLTTRDARTEGLKIPDALKIDDGEKGVTERGLNVNKESGDEGGDDGGCNCCGIFRCFCRCEYKLRT